VPSRLSAFKLARDRALKFCVDGGIVPSQGHAEPSGEFLQKCDPYLGVVVLPPRGEPSKVR
jgi:hypothetical protein